MLLVLFFVVLAFSLLLILSIVSYFISESTISLSREELSSYECGFEHHSLSRLPLSLRYFILTVVFLVFDIEVMLLAYYPSMVFYSTMFLASSTVYGAFVLILLLGLLFEWVDGSLDWVI